MFDKLTLLLRQMVVPETCDAYVQSLTVLDSYGYASSWADIAEYLESDPSDSTSLFIDTIETFIVAGLDYVLRELTVLVDGNHVMKSSILEGIKVLENWDDPESLMDIIRMENSPQETLVDLLAIVTPFHPEELLPHVLDLSPSLIDAIKNRYSGQEVALESAPDPIEPAKSQFVTRFIKRYPNSIAALAMSEDFVPYGVSMDTLVKKYTLPLQMLYPDAPEQAAQELIGLCLISDTEFKDIQKVTKEFLDDAFVDMNFITQMNIHVDRQLSEALRVEV